MECLFIKHTIHKYSPCTTVFLSQLCQAFQQFLRLENIDNIYALQKFWFLQPKLL